MLGDDRAFLGDDIPAAVGARLQLDDAVAQDHVGTALLRRARIGMRRAIGVEMAFVGIVKAAQHVADIDDRADLLDLLGVGSVPRAQLAACLVVQEEAGPLAAGGFPRLVDY